MNTNILRRQMALPTLLVAVLALNACDGTDLRGPTTPGVPTSETGVRAHANATPSRGGVPMTVRLAGWSTGGAVLYEWDFEGDGIYDWSSAYSGNTEHTFTEPGTYLARLRVTDETGNSDTDTVGICLEVPFCEEEE